MNYRGLDTLFDNNKDEYAAEMHLHLDDLKKRLVNDVENLPKNFLHEVRRLAL